MSEFPVALAAFLFAIVMLTLTAAWLGLRGILGRAKVIAAPSPTERRVRAVFVGVMTLGALCVLYGRLVEPWWPKVEHVRIESARWPGSSGPLRLVQLSDLHCEREPRLEEKLPALVAAEHPDVIVFTGDSLNEPAGLPVLKRLLTRLVAIAPVYVVKGNWDVWYWADLDLFGGTGVHVLDAESQPLAVRGGRAQMVGAPVGKADEGIKALRAADPDALRVFLYHYPDEIYRAAMAGADLYLAGHTHGGQVALPLYGALVTFSRFGKRFEAGLHDVHGTRLYVNRGIGMEGGSAPRVRFWARPEITVLEVVGR